jgi:hypothetical protein
VALTSKEIERFVYGVFLPLIMKRCKKKIMHMFLKHFTGCFTSWYDDYQHQIATYFLSDFDIETQESLMAYFNAVYLACSGELKSNKTDEINTTLCDCIQSARGIIASDMASILEPHWANYRTYGAFDSKDSQDMEEEDDADPESFINEDSHRPVISSTEIIAKSAIYRFLSKLSGYYAACRVITKQLSFLFRHRPSFTIKVATVPFLQTTFSPFEENEYASLESYVEHFLRKRPSRLDPNKISRLLYPGRTSIRSSPYTCMQRCNSYCSMR